MDDELAHLAEVLRHRERLQERAAELRTAMAEASVRLARARLLAEQHALQRCAGFPLARLLRKQAYVRAAQYLAQQTQENLAVLHEQYDEVAAGLAATSDIPATYAAALTRKERQLRSSGEGLGPRLNELARLRDRLRAELRDLIDTAELAETAAAALEETGEALHFTAGWSVADILGGGSIVSMMKNDELDEALDLAVQADRHLCALRQRLTSTPLSATAEQLYVDAFTRFADISLDNTLVDLSVHHQITVAQDQIDSALWYVRDAGAELTARITAARAELHRAEAERDALLRP